MEEEWCWTEMQRCLLQLTPLLARAADWNQLSMLGVGYAVRHTCVQKRMCMILLSNCFLLCACALWAQTFLYQTLMVNFTCSTVGCLILCACTSLSFLFYYNENAASTNYTWSKCGITVLQIFKWRSHYVQYRHGWSMHGLFECSGVGCMSGWVGGSISEAIIMSY